MTHPLRRVSDFCPACDKPWDECHCPTVDAEEMEQEEASDTSDETEPFLPDDEAA